MLGKSFIVSWSNTKMTNVLRMQNFSAEDISRIFEMAWEDRTPIEAIDFRLG